MADLDTGIGSAPTTRGFIHFVTTTSSFPTGTQVDTTTVGDTGIGSTPMGRADAFDEYPRTVTVSASGSSFTTTAGGPS